MGTTLLAFIVISVPGLLSATCSSPSVSGTRNYGYAKSTIDNGFDPKQTGNVQESFSEGVLWAEDDAASRRSSPSLEQQQQQQEEQCENGWCAEDGRCACNPCWSGPACQEYVDRFSPRFLAEEPFFIVDSSTAVTTLPFSSLASSPLDSSTESGSVPLLHSAMQAPPSSPSTVLEAVKDEKFNKGRRNVESFLSSQLNNAALAESSAKANLAESNLSDDEESKLSSRSSAQLPEFGGSLMRSAPLFRIEAADDDLGLTCQLGQVGPAATCPCATPRYKVIGSSTTVPDDRSLASSNTNHPEETDNNRPFQESSFYNSFPERNLSRATPPSSSSSTTYNQYFGITEQVTSSSRPDMTSFHQVNCPNGWTTKKCQQLNSIMFFADEETGDVFLQNGYNLRPETYYFITLQVSALAVNSSGYKPWSEQIVATLFVKSSHTREAVQKQGRHSHYFSEPIEPKEEEEEQVKMGNAHGSSSSEMVETQEVGDNEGEADAEEEAADSKQETTGRRLDDGDDQEDDDEDGSLEEEESKRRKQGNTSETRSQQLFNYHPAEYSEDGVSRIDNNRNYYNKNNKSGDAAGRKEAWENLENEQEQHVDENEEDDNENGQRVSFASSFSKAYKENDNGNKKEVTGPQRTEHVKNKLPYALRADRPHFKYPVSSPILDFPASEDVSAFETFVPNEGYTSKRKKREVPEKSKFKMFISRIDSDGANNTSAIPLGVVAKLQLQIQVSISKPRDFTLEIRSARAKETNIKFVILSAYVISIGSDISFDKGTTNLAPFMMPWKNSTVYDSVTWKWKSVKCEKERQQQAASFHQQSISTDHNNQQNSTATSKYRRNDEIAIEFEVIAVSAEETGNVVNRWMSSTTTSTTPWRHANKFPTDKNLSQRGELMDDDLRPSPLPRSITMGPFRKSAKQFNVIRVPVTAHITFPSGHGQRGYHSHNHHHSQQHLERVGGKLAEEVMSIRKEIDEGDATARNNIADDNVGDDNDGKREGEEETHYYYGDKLKDSSAPPTTTLTTQIMLPVKYSQGSHNANISRTSNHSHSTGAQTGKSVSPGSSQNTDLKERRNKAAAEADVLLEGPTEIPQGGWVSYGIKVYLNHTSRFQLRLEPVQGNEIQYQDTVSIGDIRVVDIGKHFSSCTKIPKKRGFRVTCRKLSGRKGDYCTVESPLMRYCPTVSEGTSKDSNGVDEINSSGSGEVSSNQAKTESEEKWDDIVRKKEKMRRSDQVRGAEDNMGVEFEGIIYGFPGSAPGSQFVLRAHVHVENIDENNNMNVAMARSPETSSAADVVLYQRKTTFSLDAEKTLSGKIVHRKQKIRSKGAPQSLDVSSSMDFPDGKIPVMREFPAYHYRKRRSIFADHISNIKKRMVLMRNSSQVKQSNDSESSKNRVVSNPIMLNSYHSSDNVIEQSQFNEIRKQRKYNKVEPIAKKSRHARAIGVGVPKLESLTSSRQNSHHFSSWDNFVHHFTSVQDAPVKNANRLRKSKRNSHWSNLL